MKIRLVGGPFSGKVMDNNTYGRTILVNGTKRLTRGQRARLMVSSTRDYMMHPPIVEAEYEAAFFTEWSNGLANTYPCVHPDGSRFFRYTGRKREW